MQADTKQYPRFSVVKQDKCSGWDTENPGFIYWDICIKILVVVAGADSGEDRWQARGGNGNLSKIFL